MFCAGSAKWLCTYSRQWHQALGSLMHFGFHHQLTISVMSDTSVLYNSAVIKQLVLRKLLTPCTSIHGCQV